MMELRISAQKLAPSVHVGKEGVTAKVLEELTRQLRKHKIVKVRVLSSFEEDRRSIASAIARETKSVLVDVRGSTIVLAEDEDSQI